MTWHTPVNFASTTVSSGVLNNTTSPITFAVASGSVFGSSFPLYAVVDPTGTPEVIEVTARNGNSLTATRANAVAHSGAPKIVCAPSAEYITELQTAVDNVNVGGGGGAMTRISHQAVTGAGTNTVTFSSIPGTYKSLMLQVQVRSTYASGGTTSEAMKFTLNGDTGTNYDLSYIIQRDSNPAGNTLNSGQLLTRSGFTLVNSITNDLSPAGQSTTLTLWLPNYAGTAFWKVIHENIIIQRGNDYPFDNQFVAGIWKNTAAVTTITLATDSGSDFATGSVFTLYGVG